MPAIHPDIKYMQRCIELAAQANTKTRTNPKVGAVLVFRDRIIGEGYHTEYGKPHAEINALDNVSSRDIPLIPLSTLYVSLEPCSHYGKTPPCAHRIVQEGIKNIIIGCPDPNPIVSGNGIKYLKENGVNVTCPFNINVAEDLIQSFRAHLSEIPFIILKWAQSADNFISGKGKQTWLSNEYSKILVHKWRAECDGIMIGKNTAAIDKPLLNARLYPGKNPVRIIMDSQLSVKNELTYGLIESTTWVVNHVLEAKKNNVHYKRIKNTQNLRDTLKQLFLEGINILLVEGGTTLIQSFIREGIWNEARIIRTKIKLGDGVPAPLLHGSLIKKMNLLEDEILFVKNNSLTPI